MDQKNEQKAPLRIKNLAELKRCIRPGTELVATSHSKHPTLVGLVRVVTEVQTNAYYSVVKDQPTHQYSTCNYGKGFRSDFEKASNYLFEGTTIKVLDRRSGDNSVLYEMELYQNKSTKARNRDDKYRFVRHCPTAPHADRAEENHRKRGPQNSGQNCRTDQCGHYHFFLKSHSFQ